MARRFFVGALLFLLGCGPGPTEPNTSATPTPSATTKTTPTKIVRTSGPDCNARAMERLTATIIDAGRGDLDAGAAQQQEDVTPPDLTPVLQKLAPKLTGCNPAELEGCAFITTNVEKDGTVSGAEPFVSDGLPPEVLACLSSALKEARFQALPKAGKMTVPVTFTRN